MADITTHIQGTYDDINKWNKEEVFKKFMLLTKGLVWCEDIMVEISTFIYDLAQVDIALLKMQMEISLKNMKERHSSELKILLKSDSRTWLEKDYVYIYCTDKINYIMFLDMYIYTLYNELIRKGKITLTDDNSLFVTLNMCRQIIKTFKILDKQVLYMHPDNSIQEAIPYFKENFY